MIALTPNYNIDRMEPYMRPGYIRAIQHAGGIPVTLPLDNSQEDLEDIAREFDGFLFTGGPDVHPFFFGEQTQAHCGNVSPKRDTLEFALLKLVMKEKKPVLGICRGLQAMNVILGGGLYQDIPKQRPSGVDHHMDAPYGRTAHPIRMAEGSPLAECLGTLETGVNSCHHQAVRTLAPRLKSMAEAPPEFYDNNPDSLKIFEAFIKSC